MAASASPEVTCCSVDFTSVPRVTFDVGMVMPFSCRSVSAAAPQGALETQSATTLALLRSAREVMPSGLPGFTTISSVLRAKMTGFPTMSPEDCAVVMSLVLAEANTSAGAPCWIWVTSAPDDPRLNVMVVPGWADSNRLPSWPKVPVSEDAADTMMEPVSLGFVVVVPPDDEDELPQAVAATAAAVPAVSTIRRRCRWARCGRALTGVPPPR